MVALLNADVEAAVCREMIDRVSKHVQDREQSLLNRPLERELYLQTIGAVLALRAAQQDLSQIYTTRFNR
jgi:signal recognition particle GTPase